MSSPDSTKPNYPTTRKRTASPSQTAELKRSLKSAGFEIYRSAAGEIRLAERVRDNLIMDSGVTAQVFVPTEGEESGKFFVETTVRAQASHFPGAEEDQIWKYARDLAQVFMSSGYAEEESRSETVQDPGNPEQHLDTCYEIRLRRSVGDNLEALLAELRAAMGRQRSTADDV